MVLKMMRENGGILLSVPDAEILKAQKLLAETEGIFCDPASATVLAGAIKLAGRFTLKNRDRLVLVITGSGLKTLEDLDARQIGCHEASLENLEQKMDSVLL